MMKRIFSICIAIFTVFNCFSCNIDLDKVIKRSGLYESACRENNVKLKNTSTIGLLACKQKVLVAAAHEDHVQTAKTFVKMPGVDIDCRHKGYTPLLIASQKGHLEIVQTLLENGADKTKQSRLGYSALHLAAISGRIDVVDLLLKSGMDIEVLSSPFDEPMPQCTPLALAVMNNKLEMVAFLLSKGANLHFVSDTGRSLLHFALMCSSDQMSEFLVSAGVDTRIVDKNGLTALHIAVDEGLESIIDLLIGRGVPVDIVGSKQVTPLHNAVQVGKLNVVKKLLALGANINAQTSGGITPLHLAAAEGHDHIVDHLLKNGADKDAEDAMGVTPLFAAVEKGRDAVVSRLLRSKVDVHKQLREAEEGLTILHIASCNEYIGLIYRLCKHDKSLINKCDSYKRTSLFLAAQFGDIDVVKALVRFKADINKADALNKKPVDIAKQNGHEDVVSFLVSQQKQSKQKQKEQGYRASKNARKKAALRAAVAVQKEEKASFVEKKEAPRKSINWLKVNPSDIIDFKTTVLHADKSHVVFRQDGDAPMMLILYNLHLLSKENSPKNVRLKDDYKQKHEDAIDKFHTFSDQIDDYLSYGVRIDQKTYSKYKAMCKDLNLRISKDKYAIVVPGKIEHRYYDHGYALNDQDVSTRTGFKGAFVYIFDNNDLCHHRCFHESKSSKKVRLHMQDFNE